MNAYSMDLRERIVAARGAGESVVSVSQRFGVCTKTVRAYEALAKAGRLAPLPRPGKAPRLQPAQVAARTRSGFCGDGARDDELDGCGFESGMGATHGCLFAFFNFARPPQAPGSALQKKSRRAKERCEVKRAAFRCQIADIAPEKLVFLDECGLGLNLYRLYGWVMGGGRCVEEVPLTRGTHLSLLGAFSLPGPRCPGSRCPGSGCPGSRCPSSGCPNGLRVLWHKSGAWNRASFEAFLQDGPLPLLEPVFTIEKFAF